MIENPNFLNFNELGSLANGSRILFATDDWFAPAEWMLKDEEPIFIPDKYTHFGKWMDGWETRRKRIAGHDWCIIQLGAYSIIKGFTVDTSFFTGNFAPRISIQGTLLRDDGRLTIERKAELMGSAATEKEMKQISHLNSEKWKQILPMTKLKPGYPETKLNHFPVNFNEFISHLRVNIYPDGGIARLRIYGSIKLDERVFLNNNMEDLIAQRNGGRCLYFSNAHFGHPRNLIKNGKGINMGDGWETARRLDRPPILKINESGILQVPGYEYAVFKLACRGMIEKIIIDTNHFKGNYPDNVKIEGIDVINEENEHDSKNELENIIWIDILSPRKMGPDQEHVYNNFKNNGPFTHIKITMAPDGGISRLRIFGIINN